MRGVEDDEAIADRFCSQERASVSAIGGFAGRDLVRWGAAASVAVGLHAAAATLGYDWLTSQPSGAPQILVNVNLAPEITAPAPSPVDAPEPGPVMEQSEPQMAASEPPAEAIVPPAPPQPESLFVEPPKTKLVDKPKHEPDPPKQKQKIAAVQPRETNNRPAAPRTTAPPRAERSASLAAPNVAGESRSSVSLSSYAGQLAAHIARFKQYPAAARASGSRGVARVSYTVSRSGQVLAAHLAGSSGIAALDQEAVAAVRRAQPLPPIPANLSQPQTFTSPIAFSIN